MITPLCMEADELALWRAQADYLRKWGATNTDDPCSDCLPAFSDEMLAIGRCNGFPGRGLPTPGEQRPSERRRESNKRAARRWRARQRVDVPLNGTVR